MIIDKFTILKRNINKKKKLLRKKTPNIVLRIYYFFFYLSPQLNQISNENIFSRYDLNPPK